MDLDLLQASSIHSLYGSSMAIATALCIPTALLAYAVYNTLLFAIAQLFLQAAELVGAEDKYDKPSNLLVLGVGILYIMEQGGNLQ